MSDELDNPQPSFSAARKLSAGVGVLSAVVALLAIVVMINFLSARHFHRWVLSEDRVTSLAPLTHQVLGALTNELQVTVFFDPDEVLYSHILQLLRQYENASPRVKVTVVNYLTEPARAEEVKARCKLGPNTKDVVIFSFAGNHRVVRQTELSEYDTSQLLAGKSESVKRKSFTGESFFTAAILGLVEARRPRAYYLTGHSEHDPTTATTQTGYGKLTMLMQANNMDTQIVGLGGTNEVPADCNLLILAGPRSPVTQTEVERLNRYLNRGGRVLFLLRAGTTTGLEELLRVWGVELGDDVVTDASQDRSESFVILKNFGDHEILRSFGITQNGLVLSLPRSVTPRTTGQGSDAPQVRSLVATSDQGVAVADYRNGLRPDPRRDRRGIIPVAVAVERGGLRSVEGGSTRIVVVGESVFLGNAMLENSINRDFAGNAINWLLDRPKLVGIAPRPVREYLFQITDAQMQALQWILLAGLPGAALAVGLLVWIRRRA
ncbi:MAG: hypothetical protein RLZZ265_2311 [Verrucomicrobiota bacterium]|jgi:hypothetical protein